jgi:hypothetical membrane protein
MKLDEQRQRTAAAGCWLMAGAAYLILEAVAAAAYRPDYSYAHNYISDLGRPSRQSAGATIDSGFAWAMNAAFYLQGTLFLVGAVLLVRARRRPNAPAFLTLVAVNTLGNVVVGTIYSGHVGGPAWAHAGGAIMAIVGGNAAVLAGFRWVRGDAGARWYHAVSLGLGVLGLASFLMLGVQTTTELFIAPTATWERISVYTIIAWQMLSAAPLLRWRSTESALPQAL